MFLANIAHCIFIPRYYPFSVHFIDISSAQFTAQFWDKRVTSNLIVTVCCANSLAPYSVLNVSSPQLAYHYLFRNINKSIHSYRYYLSVIKIIVQAWLFIFFLLLFSLCSSQFLLAPSSANEFIFLPFRPLSFFLLLPLSFEDFLFAIRFLQSSHAGPSLFPTVCHFIS